MTSTRRKRPCRRHAYYSDCTHDAATHTAESRPRRRRRRGDDTCMSCRVGATTRSAVASPSCSLACSSSSGSSSSAGLSQHGDVHDTHCHDSVSSGSNDERAAHACSRDTSHRVTTPSQQQQQLLLLYDDDDDDDDDADCRAPLHADTHSCCTAAAVDVTTAAPRDDDNDDAVDAWRQRDEATCATALFLAQTHARLRTCASLSALCTHLAQAGWRHVWAALHHTDKAQQQFVHDLCRGSCEHDDVDDDESNNDVARVDDTRGRGRAARVALRHGCVCVLLLLLEHGDDDAVDACARRGIVDDVLLAALDGDDGERDDYTTTTTTTTTSDMAAAAVSSDVVAPRRGHWSECVVPTHGRDACNRPRHRRCHRVAADDKTALATTTTTTSIDALHDALCVLCGDAMTRSPTALLALRALHCLTLAQRGTRCTRAAYDDDNTSNISKNGRSASCHVPCVLLTSGDVLAVRVLRACGASTCRSHDALPLQLQLLEALTSCVMLRTLAHDERHGQALSRPCDRHDDDDDGGDKRCCRRGDGGDAAAVAMASTPVADTLVCVVHWLLARCRDVATTRRVATTAVTATAHDVTPCHMTTALCVLTNITDVAPWVVSSATCCNRCYDCSNSRCHAIDRTHQRCCRVCAAAEQLAEVVAAVVCRGAQRDGAMATAAHDSSDTQQQQQQQHDDDDAVTFALCCAVNVIEYELQAQQTQTQTPSCCFAHALVCHAAAHDVGDRVLCRRLAAAVFATYASSATPRVVRSGYYALLLAALSLSPARDDGDRDKGKPTSLHDDVAGALAIAGVGTRLGAQTAQQPLRVLVAILQEFVLFQSAAHTLTRSALLGMQHILAAVMRANRIDVTASSLPAS